MQSPDAAVHILYMLQAVEYEFRLLFSHIQPAVHFSSSGRAIMDFLIAENASTCALNIDNCETEYEVTQA